MKIKHLFFLSVLSVSSLFGGIESHFKPCPNKSGKHGMKNIDFIYMINLDQRPEKFATSVKELAPYNIKPYRFSAVNGWELSFETVNDVGLKYESWMQKGIMGTCYLPENNWQPLHEIINVVGRTYFCHCMARGPIGIVLSHTSILNDAYRSGYKTIWVMEDDIHVVRDPNVLSDYIDDLNKLVGSQNWDILFTDQDTKNNNGKYVPCTGYAKKPNFTPQNPERFAYRKDLNSELRKVGARYGAYSMIVKRSGMKKILDFIKTYKIFLPYDMEFYLPNDIRMYAVINDVVTTTLNAPSDNGGPRYKDKDPK